MPQPTVGQRCVFVAQDGTRRDAQITAVYDPDPANDPNILDVRVDVRFAPGALPLDAGTALHAFHALHRSQQTENAAGELRNYWEELDA